MLENESSGEEGESISNDTSDDQESDGADETTETHNKSKETLTKKAGPKSNSKSKSVQIGEETSKNTINKKDKPLERKGSKVGSNKVTSNNQNNSLISNEYDDYDTSDEEDIRNTVGNVPKNW